MKTVTIQIGNTDNKLTQERWAAYVSQANALVGAYANDVHFFGGPPCWERWQNCAWVIVVDEEDIPRLKVKLLSVKEKFGQCSVAWTVGDTEFIS